VQGILSPGAKDDSESKTASGCHRASTGIGYELAKCCAEESFDLVVVADEPEIMTAGKDFEALGAKVDCLQADLAEVEGVDKLCGLIASGQSKRWPTCSTRK